MGQAMRPLAARSNGQSSTVPVAGEARAAGSNVVADLCRLVELTASGFLSDLEFQAAKAQPMRCLRGGRK